MKQITSPFCTILLALAFALPSLQAEAGGHTPCQPKQTSAAVIAAHLGSPNKAARAAGMKALKHTGQATLPVLIRLAQEGSASQRRGALIGLASSPDPGIATSTYIRALSDPNSTVRGIAAHALAMAAPGSAQQTARQIEKGNSQASEAAAYALTLMKTKAIPSLIQLLHSPQPIARAKAAWLLGRMGPSAQSAIPSLITALSDDDDRLLHIIAEAIDLIGAPSGMLTLHLQLIDHTGNCPVARVGKQATPTLIRLLNRPGTPLAQAAFKTLANLGLDAKPGLVQAVANGTPSQRTASAILLTGIDPALVQTLPEDIRGTLSKAAHQE